MVQRRPTIEDPLDWSVMMGLLVFGTLLLIAVPDQLVAVVNAAIGAANHVPGVHIEPVAKSNATAELKAGNFGGTELDDEQVKNAQTIIKVGRENGASDRDIKIALMTALQESTLVNLDHGDDAGPDSVGLFQQRPSQGWGTREELLKPETSAQKFFEVELKVDGRDGKQETEVAQTVQKSAYPDAYQKWEPVAAAIMAQASTLSDSTGTAGSTADLKAASFRMGGATGWKLAQGDLAMTADHVIAAADEGKYSLETQVKTQDGQQCSVKVLKEDKSQDLALLKVGGACASLPGLQLGTSSTGKMTIGGFPDQFKNAWTTTEGQAIGMSGDITGESKIEYKPDKLPGMSPGYSGGPCVIDGKAVGVVSNGTSGQGQQSESDRAWCADIPDGWVSQSQ